MECYLKGIFAKPFESSVGLCNEAMKHTLKNSVLVRCLDFNDWDFLRK